MTWQAMTSIEAAPVKDGKTVTWNLPAQGRPYRLFFLEWLDPTNVTMNMAIKEIVIGHHAIAQRKTAWHLNSKPAKSVTSHPSRPPLNLRVATKDEGIRVVAELGTDVTPGMLRFHGRHLNDSVEVPYNPTAAPPVGGDPNIADSTVGVSYHEHAQPVLCALRTFTDPAGVSITARGVILSTGLPLDSWGDTRDEAIENMKVRLQEHFNPKREEPVDATTLPAPASTPKVPRIRKTKPRRSRRK